MTTTNEQRFPIGSVVWAPTTRGEHRFRVLGHDEMNLILKLPGSDAGTFKVDAAKCFPSTAAPTTFGEWGRS